MMKPYQDIPNLRHLRMAQVIGRLGGVTCAARELNTSQPAVTLAISNLEEMLGAEIFDRRATGTYPTEVGRQFLLRVDRFFDTLTTAVHRVLEQDVGDDDRPLPLVERIVTGTQLRSLVIVSEPAGIAAAAEKLDVSVASLYRSARSLEQGLGRALFDRSAHGPVCNRTGALLAREIQKALLEVRFAIAEVGFAKGSGEVDIIVGALPMSGSFELAKAITAFTALRPAARVKIVTGDYHTLLHHLTHSRIDMIFGLLRKPDWTDQVEEEMMFHDSYCVVTRPGHPLTRLDEVSPRALLDYGWVVPAEGTPRRRYIEKLFAGLDPAPTRNIEANSMTCMRALLLGSDLITVMTHSEAHLDTSLGNVECLPCRWLDAVPPKGVTTAAGWLPTEAHRDFLDCLRAATADCRHDRPARRAPLALAS